MTAQNEKLPCEFKPQLNPNVMKSSLLHYSEAIFFFFKIIYFSLLRTNDLPARRYSSTQTYSCINSLKAFAINYATL